MADQQPIDDDLLGKFLAGETDPAESARVRQWLASVKPMPVPQPKRRVFGGTSLWRITALLTLVAGMGWLTAKLRFYGHHHPAESVVVLTANEQPISKTLPDGTHILLNRHSTLRYPTVFAEERRDVTLTGEAFFEVTSDSTRPFHIDARNSVVQVLGTSFTVRAYDAHVSVAVRTGQVRFSRGRKAVLLTKNQQATIEASSDTIRRLPVSPNAFAYKTGILVFRKEPLRDVIQAINQYYNADVQLANTKLGNCLLTTRFDKMPLEAVLNITAETLGLQVRYVGKQVVLDGNGCQ